MKLFQSYEPMNIWGLAPIDFMASILWSKSSNFMKLGKLNQHYIPWKHIKCWHFVHRGSITEILQYLNPLCCCQPKAPKQWTFWILRAFLKWKQWNIILSNQSSYTVQWVELMTQIWPVFSSLDVYLICISYPCPIKQFHSHYYCSVLLAIT